MSDAITSNQTLGRYQLLVAIARGGMGQVWLARLQGARGFNKLVAVKTLLAGAGDARLEGMLMEEARLASLIQHANVVHTLELGEHEGTLYLAMEWVDGEPLSFLVERAQERGGMPIEVAVALASQVLAGLHAAHELHDHTGALGVVHRDVSPHNVLVTYDGVAKLLDFGIAKATRQGSSSNTETGEIKGKFSYMAPEQIMGADVDRRCDIFAAGIVLYLLSTGKHPFKHHNTAAVIHSITTDDPVSAPSTVKDDYPSALDAIVLKALEKDVEKRWATAEDMRIALEQAVPEAFGDTGRARLREFMERVVGDRKVARREAVRRAQVAADARDVGTGARAALQSSSGQSASSLRAISISNAAPGDGSDVVRITGEHTQAKVEKRARGPWIAAALGAGLALAVALPVALRAPEPVKAAATGGVRAGTPLPARVSMSAAATNALPLVPAPTAPVAAPEPPSSAIASALPERPPPKTQRSKTRIAAAKKPKLGVDGPIDLLPPDY
jgi:hypothetical protein